MGIIMKNLKQLLNQRQRNKYVLKNCILNINAPIWYKKLSLFLHFFTIPAKMVTNLFPTIFISENYDFTEDNGIVIGKKQCLYHFLSEEKDNTIALTTGLIQGKYLLSKYDTINGGWETRTVDVANLAYMNLVMLKTKDADLKDAYEYLLVNLIKNDYSLIEYYQPYDSMLAEIYNERLKEAMLRPEVINMKSYAGRMCPEYDLTTRNALILLATLKIMSLKLRAPEGEQLYKRFFWKYGYGIMNLIPSNDIESLISLYVLIKLDKNAWYWRLPFKYLYHINKNNCSDLQQALFSDVLENI